MDVHRRIWHMHAREEHIQLLCSGAPVQYMEQHQVEISPQHMSLSVHLQGYHHDIMTN